MPELLNPNSEPRPAALVSSDLQIPALVLLVSRVQLPDLTEPKITVTILGMPVPALLDTGASISLIGDYSRALQKMKREI